MFSRFVKGRRGPSQPPQAAEAGPPPRQPAAEDGDIAGSGESDQAFINRALEGVEVLEEQTIDFMTLPEEIKAQFKYVTRSED